MKPRVAISRSKQAPVKVEKGFWDRNIVTFSQEDTDRLAEGERGFRGLTAGERLGLSPPG